MRVHHVALRTAHLHALRRFYAGVLGLVVTREAEGRVWLDAAGTIVMLEEAGPGEPRVAAGTMDLLAFAIEREERGARRAALAEAGIPIEGETDFTLYLRDPDGRRVGLSHYPHPRGEGA